jgi:hypothetical protein
MALERQSLVPVDLRCLLGNVQLIELDTRLEAGRIAFNISGLSAGNGSTPDLTLFVSVLGASPLVSLLSLCHD